MQDNSSFQKTTRNKDTKQAGKPTDQKREKVKRWTRTDKRQTY